MPSTVREVFAAGDLVPDGVVRWGTRVPELGPGVYTVALTDGLDATDVARPRGPVSVAALQQLLAVRPELTLDGIRPDPSRLGARLAAFGYQTKSLSTSVSLAPRSRRVSTSTTARGSGPAARIQAAGF